MGVGKTSVGRRIAARLDLPFFDADEEIEAAAALSVADIFELHGEAEFRALERRVIARLLEGPPCVLATGGGAFVQSETRKLLNEKALTVWLDADLDLLAKRATRRDVRPLLRDGDPKAILADLMKARRPAYAQAAIHARSLEGAHGRTVESVLAALGRHLETQP